MDYGSQDRQKKFFDAIPNSDTVLSRRMWIHYRYVFWPTFILVLWSIITLSWIFQDSSILNFSVLIRQETSESIQLAFEVRNKYSDLYGRPSTQYPWVDDLHQIAEPYKVTTFVASGILDDRNSFYKWKIGDDEYVSNSVTTIFSNSGSNIPIVLSAIDNNGFELAMISGVIHVRYVKREVRQLDKSDMNHVLDAMETLYRVREPEGRLLYGNNYRDAGYFVRLHNTLAGTRECDHMHDGMGFLTQHVALSLDFERVLHLVDPTVTLPYWEYTIESVDVDKANNAAPFYDSIVWSEDMFGPFPDSGPEQGDNGQHEIKTGRWANIPVSKEYWGADTSPVMNGFGALRSPWNMNGSKYLTRGTLNYGFLFDSIPNCKDHYEQMQYRNFSEFGMQIQYKPHGSMHTVIGGAWGVDYYKVLGSLMPWPVVRDIALRGFGLQKDMWRKGLLECPTSCDILDSKPCACSCPLLTKWLADGAENVVLRRLGIQQVWLDSSPDIQTPSILLKLLCNANGEAPAIGDSMCSAAPLDPTFWILHPTSERMWQWARLNGLVLNWPDVTYRHEPGYCSGHGLNDSLSWKNLFDRNDHFYSNEELYDLLDPAQSDVLDYVYNDFKWEHCSEAYGYPVGLIDEKVL